MGDRCGVARAKQGAGAGLGASGSGPWVAEKMGVSRGTVALWQQRGMPVSGADGRGRPIFDLAACLAWRRTRTGHQTSVWAGVKTGRRGQPLGQLTARDGDVVAEHMGLVRGRMRTI